MKTNMLSVDLGAHSFPVSISHTTFKCLILANSLAYSLLKARGARRRALGSGPWVIGFAPHTSDLCLTNDLADVGRSNSKCFQVVFLVGPSRTPKSFDVGLTWFSLPITIANTSPDL